MQRRMAALVLALSVLAVTACGGSPASQPSSVAGGPVLDPEGWSPGNHQALLRLVEENRGTGRYATFDWDNTSQARDVGEATVGQADADGSIKPSRIPAAVVPSFTLDGKKVAIDQGISAYYNAYTDISPSDPFAAYPSDNIIAQFWTGQSLAIFTQAVSAAYAGGAGMVELETGTEQLVGGFGRQFAYPQMADLYGYLRSNGIDVWIISAGITWAVRWMVKNQMNPMIAAKYGEAAQIPLEQVVGITTLLKDKRTGELQTDNALARTTPNPLYLNLDPAEIQNYEITANPDAVNSWRGGKVAAIQDLVTRGRPLLAGGDSQGDFEMLNHAENRL